MSSFKTVSVVAVFIFPCTSWFTLIIPKPDHVIFSYGSELAMDKHQTCSSAASCIGLVCRGECCGCYHCSSWSAWKVSWPLFENSVLKCSYICILLHTIYKLLFHVRWFCHFPLEQLFLNNWVDWVYPSPSTLEHILKVDMIH
jgi:hypothetical protein